MRTTVELSDEHRAALLALATRRGDKGFSAVLSEAVSQYLDAERDRERRRQEVRELAGSLAPEDVEPLRQFTRALRERWR